MNKDDLNKEDLNSEDEKELDSLFDNMKNTKLKRAIKKAKWHSILRNVLISLLVLGVVMIGGSILNRQILFDMGGTSQISVDEFNLISAPNKYIGESTRYHYILRGKDEYTTYKIIEGKIVYTGEKEYNYGLFQNSYGNRIGINSPLIFGRSYNTEDLKIQKYNKLGQREMVFYYPFNNYQEYKSDLNLVQDIESDKVMEIALSFDKAYGMDEVEKMLPDNVTLAWYWVNDLNEEEKKASEFRKITLENSGGEKYVAKVGSEQTVYGIKAYNNSGESLESPEEEFIRALESGVKYDSRYKSEFERVYNNISGEDKKLTKDDIEVFGVVVTGSANDLKDLQNLPFIKASSLGVVTEVY
jgi:Sigma factor regulator C-terminal/Sigma factor regulator N-terminal